MEIGGPLLRSLDAIHLATAAGLGDELGALITYDRRMLDEAEALGLPVMSPGHRRESGGPPCDWPRRQVALVVEQPSMADHRRAPGPGARGFIPRSP